MIEGLRAWHAGSVCECVPHADRADQSASSGPQGMNGAHIMQRPASWKVVTVDAAMARLYSGFEYLRQQHMVGANIVRFGDLPPRRSTKWNT